MGGSRPHLTRFFGLIRAQNPNGIMIDSAIFAQMTTECPHTYNGTPLPPSKLPISNGDLDPHLIHGSLGQPKF